MTTGYSDDTTFGLELIDERFEMKIARPATTSFDSEAAEIVPGLGSEAEDWSVQGHAALATTLRRTIRTVGPLLAADLAALALAGLFAQLVLWAGSIEFATPLSTAMVFALLPLIGAYWLSGLYSEIWVHPVIELRQLVHINTIMLLAVSIGTLVAEPLPIWIGAAWVAACVLTPLFRVIVRIALANNQWWGYPTLVIGSGEAASQVAATLLGTPRAGLRPVMMTDPSGVCRASALPVVNEAATLESLVRLGGIRHAIVSLPEANSAMLATLLDRYSNLIPHMLVLSDTTTLPTLWGSSRSGGRLSGIEVRNGLLLATLQFVKRILDLTVAIVVLVMTAPVMAGIILAIRTSGPGPVFFGHRRIGRRGKTFKTWKFRTMYEGAETMLRDHLERDPAAMEEWTQGQKLKNDPRVTPIGRVLRRTSLDELPQVWNVLVGEMSIVGPRPIVGSEVARYGETFRLYAKVKPGITGLWQSSGRSGIGYEERVQLDQFYIRHWSPWLDIYILAKTVVALTQTRDAY